MKPAVPLSPSDSVAYVNGSFVPLRDATLPVTDTGVVQGVTLTETLRTFDGSLFFVSEHLKRLAKSVAKLKFEVRIDEPSLTDVLQDVVARNAAHGWPDMAVVIVATPGPHPAFDADSDSGSTLIVHVRPVPSPGYAALYRDGWSLHPHVGMHGNNAGYPRSVKHRSRLNWYLAQKQQPAAADRHREPLFVDPDDVITETNSGNVVAVRGRQLIVAPSHRVLPGVTQCIVTAIAEELGYAVREVALSLAELQACDEVFLTSSAYMLGPVGDVDDRAIGDGRPGTVWRELATELGRRVGCDFVTQAAAAVVRPDGQR